MKYYLINEEDEPVLVIHEDSEKEYKNTVKLIKERCRFNYINWGIYFDFMRIFADLKYNHAIIKSHRSFKFFEIVILM